MKTLILIFISFYQLDHALAEDGMSVRVIEQQLQKMAKLNVASPRPMVPHAVPADVTSDSGSPLSCDIKMSSFKQEVRMDYSCDSIKRIKTETLAIAAN